MKNPITVSKYVSVLNVPSRNPAADLLSSGLNICMSGSATSCEECLLIHPSCAWCAQEVSDCHPVDTC